MASAKMFKLENGLSVDTVGRGIEGFLRDKKKMRTEAVSSQEGYMIKGESQETWLRFIGLGLSQQVQLIRSGDVLSVTVMESRWIEKVLVWFGYLILETIIYFLFWPLLFVPLTLWICVIVGIVRQAMLPNQILEFTEMFIMGGGKSVSVNMGFGAMNQGAMNMGNMNMGGNMGSMNMGMANAGGGSFCPKCRAPIAANAKFCDGCGAKLGTECPHCHASVAVGKKFCPQCGGQLETGSASRICPNCHNEVEAGQKFCKQCGTPMP